MKILYYIVLLFVFPFLTGACSKQYLTPQQYGAVADGNSDCTEQIRTMLQDMKRKNIPYAKFPAGKYLVSDGFTIDFPCRIIGRKATIITNDTLKGKYAIKYTLSERGDTSPNEKKTELCLNFKVHGVPVAFHGYNNVYMHDCTVSTFTGTDTYYKNTKFWFAIDCDRFYNAAFKRIHFDQPVNYKKNQFNSADGLHITGLCHDILIENCDGHTGDDFIALNANEGTPGNIYNITIRKCDIGSDAISKNGIRVYGMSSRMRLKISNLLIEKSKIACINSPCVYFTNNANTSYSPEHYNLQLDNVRIKNCLFTCPEYELATQQHPSSIRFAGVDANDICIENVKAIANTDSLSYFINVFEQNQIENLMVKKCSYYGNNSLRFIKLGRDGDSNTSVKKLIVEKCNSSLNESDMIEQNVPVGDLILKKIAYNKNNARLN